MNRKYLASWWFPIGLCLFSCGHTGHPLDDRVAAFWTALVERDRVTAQQFVAPASRNDFLRHSERLYRSWKIENVHEKSSDEAIVRVAYEGYLEELRRFQQLRESQRWKRIDGEWFLHVDSPEDGLSTAFEKIYSVEESTQWSTEKDGRVAVNKQIRIPFFNRAQLGTLTIRNGTGKPVRIARVGLDEILFEISENPGQIPAGEKRHLKIVHRGSDELKDQKSPMTVVIEHGGELTEYPVEILYNYLSPGARGILGLTPEKIPDLKRSDKVSPAIKVQVPAEQEAEIQKIRERIGQGQQPG